MKCCALSPFSNGLKHGRILICDFWRSCHCVSLCKSNFSSLIGPGNRLNASLLSLHYNSKTSFSSCFYKVTTKNPLKILKFQCLPFDIEEKDRYCSQQMIREIKAALLHERQLIPLLSFKRWQWRITISNDTPQEPFCTTEKPEFHLQIPFKYCPKFLHMEHIFVGFRSQKWSGFKKIYFAIWYTILVSNYLNDSHILGRSVQMYEIHKALLFSIFFVPRFTEIFTKYFQVEFIWRYQVWRKSEIRNIYGCTTVSLSDNNINCFRNIEIIIFVEEWLPKSIRSFSLYTFGDEFSTF